MRVDLNADVGEGAGQDLALMRFITSANVACGAHAGDMVSMRETVQLAHDHGVAVGAHPSFPDREGFGRRDLRLSAREIEDVTASQIRALAVVANEGGLRLQHVKPHGALFNVAARDRAVAEAIVRAVVSVDPALRLFGLPNSALLVAGHAAGLRTACEVFADRAYQVDGSLVPRAEPGAVIDDLDQVLARVVTMVRERVVVALDGSRVPITFDTICVHGDTPGAANLAARVRAALEAERIDVCAVGVARGADPTSALRH
jgi:UPF0271 protein